MRTILMLAAMLAVPALEATAQTQARRGAVVGGLIGAAATGGFGALIGRAVCDAADCSDAWIDGAVPGFVVGGFAGAALGAAVGALIKASPAPAAQGSRRGIAVLIDGSVARAEWNSLDQTVRGARGLAGIRLGGLVVGPSVEYLGGGGWRIWTAALAARLDPARGLVRPFVEASAGRFSWRHPAVIAHCDPVQPDCTFEQGTLSDAYLGAAGAVGASIGDRRGAWRVHALVRFHYAGGRPIGEPFSTTSRELRQLSVGGEIGFGTR